MVSVGPPAIIIGSLAPKSQGPIKQLAIKPRLTADDYLAAELGSDNRHGVKSVGLNRPGSNGRGVADLASDPNSAQQSVQCQFRHPELGSDRKLSEVITEWCDFISRSSRKRLCSKRWQLSNSSSLAPMAAVPGWCSCGEHVVICYRFGVEF